ncbi:MAG: shikimate kinase [Flavobacteriales bacterium]
MRIFIIGFMCSGKSVVGRELAKLTGMRFTDIDRAIEARIGPILPWMRINGEAAFRAKEAEVLDELFQEEDLLVACGGGTPMAADNMDRMLAAGHVAYLEVDRPLLLERAKRVGGDRPLLFGLKDEALAARISELMDVREPVYRRAPWHVPATGTPREAAMHIAELAGMKVQDK